MKWVNEGEKIEIARYERDLYFCLPVEHFYVRGRSTYVTTMGFRDSIAYEFEERIEISQVLLCETYRRR